MQLRKPIVEHRIVRILEIELLAKRLFHFPHSLSLAKNGVECQRIYIDFKQANHVDQLMANEPFQLNGRSVRIMRQLPQSFVLHDRCVTGLKVKILSNNGQEFSATTLNDRHLRKYFEQFGTIRSSRWVDSTHQEALFVYAQ